MQSMRRSSKHWTFSLLQLGWLIFALGAAWDLIYHATLVLTNVVLPETLDLIGSFGHVVTFGGVVVIIYAILRRHTR